MANKIWTVIVNCIDIVIFVLIVEDLLRNWIFAEALHFFVCVLKQIGKMPVPEVRVYYNKIMGHLLHSNNLTDVYNVFSGYTKY